MVMKLAVVALIAFTFVSARENMKRQSNGPDFSEYFNQFQQLFKPDFSGFPSMPEGFGSFPSLPGIGSGSSGSSPQYKRQISPNTLEEWFNKFQEGNNFSGNLPFKPPTFGQFPSFGGSSGSSESSQNQNS